MCVCVFRHSGHKFHMVSEWSCVGSEGVSSLFCMACLGIVLFWRAKSLGFWAGSTWVPHGFRMGSEGVPSGFRIACMGSVLFWNVKHLGF